MNALMLLALSTLSTGPLADEPAAPKVHKIAVGGDGGWDYLTVDPERIGSTSRGGIAWS